MKDDFNKYPLTQCRICLFLDINSEQGSGQIFNIGVEVNGMDGGGWKVVSASPGSFFK